MDGSLSSGDVVRLAGLRGAARLNGQTATLIRWHDADGRWAVEIQATAERVKVRPGNLLEVAAPPVVSSDADAMASSLSSSHYSVVDDFLSPDGLTQLVTLLRDELRDGLASGDVAGGRAAGLYARITGQAMPRGDLMRWLSPAEASEHPAIQTFLAALDSTVRSLQAAPQLAAEPQWAGELLQRHEMQVTCYPGNGARYVKHVDNNASADPASAVERRRIGRRLTAILYANPGWQEGDGGELRLHLDQQRVDIAPLANRLGVRVPPCVPPCVSPRVPPRVPHRVSHRRLPRVSPRLCRAS